MLGKNCASKIKKYLDFCVSINLVVNGPSYGEIWVDDRNNDNGVYPDFYFGNEERLGFLEWYELWLDKSIEEFEKA